MAADARKGALPLRILIAIGVSRQKEAGAAGVALNNAAELAKRGHEVDCWFLEDVLKRPTKAKRFETPLFAMALARRILRERENYDVVNLHAPWGCAYGMWRKWFRPSGAPPYVLTMQGSEERYVRAMLLEDGKGRAWHFSLKSRIWHRVFHQTLYDFSIKSANYGTVANREAWICAELKYNREPGRFWYVPNGTEERFFISREYAEKASCELLYVGTWLDRKGVYYLAEAFERLAKRLPGTGLTVAGCLVPAKEVIKFFSPEVGERVCVIPFVKREDMPALYAKHDVFVFPSLVEGMPLTLLEAMATGMPVVTTNTCGMADVVEDEKNGLLVQAADGPGLADAVERLCVSVALRKQLGVEGQQTVRHYTWEKVTAKLERILLRAAQDRPSLK